MPAQDPIIILLGETGAGKSKFISVAGKPSLNPEPEVGDRLNSCTQNVAAYKVKRPRSGRQSTPSVGYVQLLDTPGFNDTEYIVRTDNNILQEIANWLNREPDTTIAGVLWLQNMNREPHEIIGKLRGIPGVSLVTWFSHAVTKKEQKDIDSLRLHQHQYTDKKDSAWKIIEALLVSNTPLTRGELATSLQEISLQEISRQEPEQQSISCIQSIRQMFR